MSIQRCKRRLAVPLAQLELIDEDVDDEFLEAVADRHYWVGRGSQF